jgi:uncharacterized protein with PIN domain
MNPKCPHCDGTVFLVKSVEILAKPGEPRVAFVKNFVYCEKCGTIVSEYDAVQDEILKLLKIVNDNILEIGKNTYPHR